MPSQNGLASVVEGSNTGEKLLSARTKSKLLAGGTDGQATYRDSQNNKRKVLVGQLFIVAFLSRKIGISYTLESPELFIFPFCLVVVT